jgi:5'(3')-deoxyribonucleotidase
MKATDLNTAVFAFGRLNPPTIGHGQLVEMIKKQPGKPYLFLTHTQNPKKDPLTYTQKLKYAKASFNGINIGDPEVKTLIQALQKLESLGFAHIIMVAGSDRKAQFEEFLPKYNGKDYSFESVKVVSSGERDPDSEGVEGMSASKMRDHARNGDFDSFKDGVLNPSIAKSMYNDVRSGLNINEYAGMGFATTQPKRHTIVKRKKLEPGQKPIDNRSMQQKIADRRKELAKKYNYESVEYKDKWGFGESISGMPTVHVDMDGVIADFFTALAKFRGVDHWKDGGEDSVQDSIKAIQGTNFFSTLPVIPTAKQLIAIVKSFSGGQWNINSSPLRGDHENSKKHKLDWLKSNGFDPNEIIITGRKESFAVDKSTGTPNILIDDKPSNIERWTAKGGIGIRYQANKDSLSRVSSSLDIVKKYMEKYNDWSPELVRSLNTAIDMGKINEGELIPFPANSLVIDVDSKSDYYELTKDISDLSQADANKYGSKGKADVVITFQSPEVKELVAKRIKKYTGMKSKDATTNNLYHYNSSKKKKKVYEHGGRVVKGINTTPDVGVDAIKKQSGKLGFKVSNDGVPPKLREDEKFKNQDGKMSFIGTYPGTKKWIKMKKNSEPGTEDWFKTWRTMSYLTKGRKNHYMLPIKEEFDRILKEHGVYDEWFNRMPTKYKESWSAKYKKSIDCNNPKGFSQKAHCAGKKKRK